MSRVLRVQVSYELNAVDIYKPACDHQPRSTEVKSAWPRRKRHALLHGLGERSSAVCTVPLHHRPERETSMGGFEQGFEHAEGIVNGERN